MNPTAARVDNAQFRQVLGQFPTGVVVVTALDDAGQAIGMTVGSFTSVSLDPPLVAFLPDRNSSSWRALRESGDRFCVNVLGSHQEDVCRAVAVRKTDKFAGIPWRPSPSGMPIIDGAVAWIDCATDAVHEAGDHHIVIGRVDDLQLGDGSAPLLFFRGGYGSFSPLSLASGDVELLEQLGHIDLARPHLDDLAARFDTEVTAIVRVRDELVLAAAAGHTALAVSPTRVGQRLPFVPPLGSCFAAWGDERVHESWAHAVDGRVSRERAALITGASDLVRRRGYAMALGHGIGEHLETVSTRAHQGDPRVNDSTLREAIVQAAEGYNLEAPIDQPVELRLLSAPVFDVSGQVAFTVTLWGAPGLLSPGEVAERVDALLSATRFATEALCGRPLAMTSTHRG